MINTGRGAARLTFDVYTPNAADCAIKPVDLAAAEDTTLAYACSGIYAAVIHTDPNDEPLSVRLHIERPEFRKSYDDEVTVAPRSLRIHALHEIEGSGPPPVDPVIVNGMHNIRITADRRYHAGTSSVHAGGDGNWREAVPLGR